MAGGQRGRDEEMGWFEVWWDGEEVGRGSERGSMSHRKTFREEIHPPCDQTEVERLSTLALLTFDSPVAERRRLFSPQMLSYSTMLYLSACGGTVKLPPHQQAQQEDFFLGLLVLSLT